MRVRKRLSGTVTFRTSVICSFVIIQLLIAAGFLSPLSAQPPAAPSVETLTDRTALSGEWKICFDDRIEYSEPAYDDSSWKTVNIPGSLTTFAGLKNSPISGVIWLRKKFTVNPALEGSDLGLILGRIGTADQTYINGSCIGGLGEFPPGECSMWNFPRHYHIPSSLINHKGGNVIAIRIYYFLFGEVLGTVAITGIPDMHSDQAYSFFSRVMAGHIIIAMGIPIILIILILFIFRRDEKYMYHMFQMFAFFLITYEICAMWNVYHTNLLRLKVFAFSWAAINVAHPVFLHRFYKLKRKMIERILWTFLIMTGAMLLFITGKPHDVIPIIFFIIITISIGFYNLSCHVSGLFLKRPFAGIFSFFGIIVILGAIHDGIVYLVKFSGISISLGPYMFRDYLVFHYTATILVVGTSLVLVYQFVNMTREVEQLNGNLEKKVEERTFQLSDALSELGSKNVMLVELSIRDSLTGLYNHAAILERLNEVLDSAWRHHFPVSLIMMDIDFFKSFNDTYGHQTGDSIIAAVAGILKHSSHDNEAVKDRTETNVQAPDITRDSDIAGRYGGDEFMLVLPYCDRDGAVKIAERIMNKIREIVIPGKPAIKISGSFGLTTAEPGDIRPDAAGMIETADDAMYESKSGGRDRITWKTYNPEQNKNRPDCS